MSNPLFNQFGNGFMNNGISQIMGEVNRLRQTIKNPKQEVEKLLNSGAMSQQQFNEFSQMASQIMGRFNG